MPETAAATTPNATRGNVVRLSMRHRVFTYLSIVKRILSEGQFEEVELSGLGLAINGVVMCVEVLRNKKFCEISKIVTSTVNDTHSDGSVQLIPRIQVFLKKSAEFDELYAAEKATRATTRR